MDNQADEPAVDLDTVSKQRSKIKAADTTQEPLGTEKNLGRKRQR